MTAATLGLSFGVTMPATAAPAPVVTVLNASESGVLPDYFYSAAVDGCTRAAGTTAIQVGIYSYELGEQVYDLGQFPPPASGALIVEGTVSVPGDFSLSVACYSASGAATAAAYFYAQSGELSIFGPYGYEDWLDGEPVEVTSRPLVGIQQDLYPFDPYTQVGVAIFDEMGTRWDYGEVTTDEFGSVYAVFNLPAAAPGVYGIYLTGYRTVWTPDGPMPDLLVLGRRYDVGLTFRDVPYASGFYTDIEWLADSGITTGYGEGVFGVGDPVLREQMAAFLYRNAGSPAVNTSGCHTFADVPAGTEFDRAICWLKQQGITTGYSPTRFGYGDSVLREQMAAFLYRAAGSPAVNTSGCHTFTDVPASSGFNTAICWLRQQGITQGYSPTTYGYGDPVLREQMAAFLHRWN